MTGFINESDETSKRMVSKYEESASNIDNIEEIIQGLMCELGIGGFMGIDDIKPGMKLSYLLIPKMVTSMNITVNSLNRTVTA